MFSIYFESISVLIRDIYIGGEGKFLYKLITGKNLKEVFMKKGREKGGKEENRIVIKHTLKYLYEA